MLVKFGADAPIKSYGGSKLPKNNRGDPYQKIKFFLKNQKNFYYNLNQFSLFREKF